MRTLWILLALAAGSCISVINIGCKPAEQQVIRHEYALKVTVEASPVLKASAPLAQKAATVAQEIYKTGTKAGSPESDFLMQATAEWSKVCGPPAPEAKPVEATPAAAQAEGVKVQAAKAESDELAKDEQAQIKGLFDKQKADVAKQIADAAGVYAAKAVVLEKKIADLEKQLAARNTQEMVLWGVTGLIGAAACVFLLKSVQAAVLAFFVCVLIGAAKQVAQNWQVIAFGAGVLLALAGLVYVAWRIVSRLTAKAAVADTLTDVIEHAPAAVAAAAKQEVALNVIGPDRATLDAMLVAKGYKQPSTGAVGPTPLPTPSAPADLSGGTK